MLLSVLLWCNLQPFIPDIPVVYSVVNLGASIGFQSLIRVEQVIGANWREQCQTAAEGRRLGLNDWKKTSLVYSLTGRVAVIFDVIRRNSLQG